MSKKNIQVAYGVVICIFLASVVASIFIHRGGILTAIGGAGLSIVSIFDGINVYNTRLEGMNLTLTIKVFTFVVGIFLIYSYLHG